MRCQGFGFEGSETTQLVGFEDITGFGPLVCMEERKLLNGTSGTLDSSSVLDNGVSLVDQEGHPLANAMVDLTLTDQCGNVTVFEQDFQRAVVVPAGGNGRLCAACGQWRHPRSGFDHGWHVSARE